jgi:hypothetical protein
VQYLPEKGGGAGEGRVESVERAEVEAGKDEGGRKEEEGKRATGNFARRLDNATGEVKEVGKEGEENEEGEEVEEGEEKEEVEVGVAEAVERGEVRKMGEAVDEAGGMSQDPRAFSKRAARAAAGEGEANASLEANDAKDAKEVAVGEGTVIGGADRKEAKGRAGDEQGDGGEETAYK